MVETASNSISFTRAHINLKLQKHLLRVTSAFSPPLPQLCSLPLAPLATLEKEGRERLLHPQEVLWTPCSWVQSVGMETLTASTCSPKGI